MKTLRFNQDATCCVTIQGKTVSIYNCDPFGKCFNMDCEDSPNTNRNNETPTLNTGNMNNNALSNNQMGPIGLSSHGSNIAGPSSGLIGDEDCVVEMLFSTSLVAMAIGNNTSRRKLKIVNTKRKSTICELVFPSDVVDVVMNRKRMCILLSSDQIFIYDISCMKPLETIDLWEDKLKLLSVHKDENYIQDINKMLKNQLQDHNDGNKTPDSQQQHNPTSRARRNSIRSRISPQMALTNDDRSILAFTTYHTSKSNPNNHLLRDIIIYDAKDVKPINYLNNVHRGNISCLAINQDGTLISTASDKGTIIRVYNTGVSQPDSNQFNGKTPLYCEFRRGNRPCNLYQLTFNAKSTLIGCVGDSGTIHIFKLNDDSNNNNLNNSHISNSSTDPILSRRDELALQANESQSSGSTTSTYQSNLERSRQMAHFLSKRIKASIPNQNLQRDFAHITVTDPNVRYCLGFPNEFPNHVYLAGDDGKFRTFAIPQTAGKCVLTSTNTFM